MGLKLSAAFGLSLVFLAWGSTLVTSIPSLQVFIFLFVFRYTRLVVHTFAFLCYKPIPVRKSAVFRPQDVTVIVPTVSTSGLKIVEVIERILANKPGKVVVVVAGPGHDWEQIRKNPRCCGVEVIRVETPNKRKQICEAMKQVSTPLTVLCDDSVYWPANFLPHCISPFENPDIGIVGTSKLVRRHHRGFFSIADFTNFLGCLYLSRRNFDMAATNSIDGGVSTVSGRTAAVRSSILQDPGFTYSFTHEYLHVPLLGWKIGPLNADDDKFITRWVVSKGWGIKIQHCPEATTETELGDYPRFFLQCLRWARTSWRSNLRSLLSERIVWIAHPWCLYAVYVTGLMNMALFYDGAMLWMLFSSFHKIHTATGSTTPIAAIAALICWILLTKVVKLIPHFIQHHKDVAYFPCYILFAYLHSLLKLYALLTAWNIRWGSRPNLDTVQATRARQSSINGNGNYETEMDDKEKEKLVLANA